MNDFKVLERVNEMCEESLSPAEFEMWEEVLKALFNSRKNLQDSALGREG